MKLRVLGSGEAFDSTGLGNNSCLLEGGRNGPVILFDCGYQIPERLWRLDPLYRRLGIVYLTHLHADHAFGIVPLLTRFWEERRAEPLLISGPLGVRAYVRRLLELGYPGMLRRLPYELRFQELKDGDAWKWGRLRLRCARSDHSVVNLALRVEGPKGVSFALSGDGQLNQKTQALFEGVRLLLHEVYFPEKKNNPMHADLKSLSKFGRVSDIERIGVTHIGRGSRHTVEKRVAALARRDPRWFVVRPGMEIPLERLKRERTDS
jgi:ribonuclease BN (tRNA processing enzyme)